MNYRFVINQLGLLLMVLSAVLLLVAAWEVFNYWYLNQTREGIAQGALMASGGVGLVIGGAMAYLGRSEARARFGRHEALLLVACSWLFGAALCALPFFLWTKLPGSTVDPHHPFHTFIDCYFEAMSGLTTTGATVVGDVEALPRGLLIWRALTHWLGGLGIIVLFVAVLPSLGAAGKRLFSIEAPGPAPTGVRPRIRDTARILWFIYLGLTVAQALALRLCGMPWFDAICHAMSTIATGGLSTRNASIGAYALPEIVVFIVFMVLAGANFNLYYQLIRGQFAAVWRDTEMRVYLATLAIASFIIVASLVVGAQGLPTTTGQEHGVTLGRAVEQGVFTAVSIQTTTGFCTGDFDTWPFLAQATLVTLMFIGGCAGSTAGGMKVIRVWIALKILFSEVQSVFNPNVVRPVRIGAGTAISTDTKLSVMIFCFGFVLLFAVGALLVQLIEGDRCDFTTSATAAVATLCTTGPGLGRVGAIQNYGWMQSESKAVLSLLMVLGRLEVFAIFVLFVPSFWRGK